MMRKIELLHPEHKNVYRTFLNLTIKAMMVCMLMLANWTPANASSEMRTSLVEDTCNPHLTINNNGHCPVNIYHWVPTGDIFHCSIQPGQHWSVQTEDGEKWRAVDIDNNWSNLLYDEHYMLNGCHDQVWDITPDYCPLETELCPNGLLANASFENGVDEWQCVNGPYSVESSYAMHGDYNG